MKQEAAKNAKKRLNILPKTNYVDETYFLCGEKLSVDEVVRFYEITSQIVSSKRFVNPIELLINREQYEKLDEENKFRYLLELCSIFLKIKKCFIQ